MEDHQTHSSKGEPGLNVDDTSPSTRFDQQKHMTPTSPLREMKNSTTIKISPTIPVSEQEQDKVHALLSQIEERMSRVQVDQKQLADRVDGAQLDLSQIAEAMSQVQLDISQLADRIAGTQLSLSQVAADQRSWQDECVRQQQEIRQLRCECDEMSKETESVVESIDQYCKEIRHDRKCIRDLEVENAVKRAEYLSILSTNAKKYLAERKGAKCGP